MRSNREHRQSVLFRDGLKRTSGTTGLETDAHGRPFSKVESSVRGKPRGFARSWEAEPYPAGRWRAEADETENYTYAIALQNEA